MDLKRYEAAPTFDQYLDHVERRRDRWTGVYKGAQVPRNLAEAARISGGTWLMVALLEDWCDDSGMALPVVARFAREAGWELRVLERHENRDVAAAHVTAGRTRSGPVIIV
ncbi:MAG TPA: thioredoxin family protein, partial [Longimicrobiales bacterium]|nr:thioredoxin family protein [Longimicrobiales bacterium]